jgi:hypothetical protein
LSATSPRITPGCVEGHDEAGQAGGAGTALEVAEDGGVRRDLAVGDELLAAVQDVVVAVAARSEHADGVLGVLGDEQVAAGGVLGDGVAGEHRLVAAEHRQEPGLQARVAGEQDRRLPEHRGAEDERRAGALGCDLLERHSDAELAEAQAAVLLGHHQTEQAQLVAGAHEVPVEVVGGGLVVGARTGSDVVDGEGPCAVLELLHLGGSVVSVGWSSWSGRAKVVMAGAPFGIGRFGEGGRAQAGRPASAASPG